MFDLYLDWQLFFLCLLIGLVFWALLLPTPDNRREGPRTHDTRHTRRPR